MADAGEAGELLGISAAAARQRVLRGQLPRRKFEGRHLRLEVQDLDLAVKNGSYDARPQHHIDKWAERCANTPALTTKEEPLDRRFMIPSSGLA